jgi:hypothetical protein
MVTNGPFESKILKTECAGVLSTKTVPVIVLLRICVKILQRFDINQGFYLIQIKNSHPRVKNLHCIEEGLSMRIGIFICAIREIKSPAISRTVIISYYKTIITRSLSLSPLQLLLQLCRLAQEHNERTPS